MLVKSSIIPGYIFVVCIFCGTGWNCPFLDISKSRNESATSKTQQDGPDGLKYISSGEFDVDVMELVAPARVNELTIRIRKSVQKNQEWFAEHVKKTEPGKPLPYDSRLGLSKEEYDEYLQLARQYSTRKKSQFKLKISMKDSCFELDGGRDMPDLAGIEIDLKNDEVRTPFCVLRQRAEINASKDSALGAWKGIEWRHEESSSNGNKIVKLAVGRLTESGRAVITYDVKSTDTRKTTRISHILNYDFPVKN